MKIAAVNAGPKVVVKDAPFPELPSPNHLIIRVVVAGSNPKDWAIAERSSLSTTAMIQTATNTICIAPGTTQGDDIAGIVHSVGTNVTNFRPGDRVAAFHEMMTPNGAFGEYGVAPEHTTFHLPASVAFEEAATIPLAAMTAALGLYQRLGLPVPWLPAQEKLPLVVYSAASAVGAFAVKLAVLSNIHPIICIAGRGIAYVETLIDSSKGDVVIDYRQGDAGVVKALEQVLGSEKLLYALDAVSDKGSFQNLMKVMDHDKGKIAVVLARKRYEGIPDTFQKFYTQVVSTTSLSTATSLIVDLIPAVFKAHGSTL